MMDIFDFALKMELDGEKYYRALAGKVEFDDLKKVLKGLAEDEKRHYEIVKLLQQQSSPAEADNPSLAKIENVFAINKDIGLSPREKEYYIVGLRGEQLDVYRSALAKEQESVALYKKLKESVVRPEEKLICIQLMHEEEKHAQVLDTIIGMLNNVNDWVEAAEFNHLKTRY